MTVPRPIKVEGLERELVERRKRAEAEGGLERLRSEEAQEIYAGSTKRSGLPPVRRRSNW